MCPVAVNPGHLEFYSFSGCMGPGYFVENIICSKCFEYYSGIGTLVRNGPLQGPFSRASYNITKTLGGGHVDGRKASTCHPSEGWTIQIGSGEEGKLEFEIRIQFKFPWPTRWAPVLKKIIYRNKTPAAYYVFNKTAWLHA